MNSELKPKDILINTEEVSSQDPDVLDFINAVTRAGESISQLVDASPQIREFLKVMFLNNGGELILDRIDQVNDTEQGYDQFVKLISNILELNNLRNNRRDTLTAINEQLADPGLDQETKVKLKQQKVEYDRELKQDLPMKISEYINKLYKEYPDFMKQLNLSELLIKQE